MKTALPLLALSITSLNGANGSSATISNGQIQAKIYLPDTSRAFYRGTRFDWSGVIYSLRFAGHDYYGPWFTKTDPSIHDFVYDGQDIIAGPCSAITGPVDEFKPLGFEEAKPGGAFIKIGIGALRKPHDGVYDNYHLYDIADPGKWRVKSTRDSIEFIQTLTASSSGFGYVYRKIVQLSPGKPEMVLRHSIKNTGSLAIKTSVYNHNFLVLDGQPPGPGISITVPFQIQSPRPPDNSLAEIRGNQIVYLNALKGRDTVAMPLQGFGIGAEDNQIRIENTALKAGITIKTDRPLLSESLWSIRSVIAMEPFVAISIEPGHEFSWTTTYEYYTLPAAVK
jgi:hypothetical protein